MRNQRRTDADTKIRRNTNKMSDRHRISPAIQTATPSHAFGAKILFPIDYIAKYQSTFVGYNGSLENIRILYTCCLSANVFYKSSGIFTA